MTARAASPTTAATPDESRTVALRPGRVTDLDALVALEGRVFETDRLSRRSFAYFLTRGHADLIVAADGADRPVGYALVLFRRGTSLARLYSFAVDPGHRGRGIGARLLAAAERAALDGDAVWLRLEVRADNAGAIRLYEPAGYRRIGRYLDYYEDHAEALRFEKRLTALRAPECRVPYWPQSAEFTCGPAALMMAMAALDRTVVLDETHELRLWREATTVFMTSGHGGCEPFGLALAAHRRGFAATVHLTSDDFLFLDGVRSEAKRRVMRLVQADFRAEAAKTDIAVVHRAFDLGDLAALLAEGGVALVLISHWRMYREKAPHWIVAHGLDDRFVYVHDPHVDPDEHETAAAKANLPIPRAEFERMARYGRDRLRAAISLRRRGDA